MAGGLIPHQCIILNILLQLYVLVTHAQCNVFFFFSRNALISYLLVKIEPVRNIIRIAILNIVPSARGQKNADFFFLPST